jgi:hypothetical protein
MSTGPRDDAGDLHDYDARLYVGDLEIASFEDRIPPELLSVFTDQMYNARIPAAAAGPRDADPEFVNEFSAPGTQIADRLEVLGFTAARLHDCTKLWTESSTRPGASAIL